MSMQSSDHEPGSLPNRRIMTKGAVYTSSNDHVIYVRINNVLEAGGLSIWYKPITRLEYFNYCFACHGI